MVRMILTYCYRLLPAKLQHRVLEAILEAQRQLYNAALEERMGAYRNAGITRTYVDQCKALTEWRRSDPEARPFLFACNAGPSSSLTRHTGVFTGV